MSWRMLILILTIVVYLTGCGNSDSTNSDSTLVSPSEIEHLQIIQDNGDVPPGTDRYTEYNYPQSKMSSDVLQKIDKITPTIENLYCSNDGVTYEINITNSREEISTYVSNNRACGRENEITFISVEDVEYMISIFE